MSIQLSPAGAPPTPPPDTGRRLPVRWRSLLLPALLALAFSLLLAPKTRAQNLFISNIDDTGGSPAKPNTLIRASQANGAILGTANTPTVGSFSNVHLGKMLMGPDGNMYASSPDSGSILQFNGATGAYMGIYNAQYSFYDGLNCVAFGPDGNMYVGNPVALLKIGGPNTTSPRTNYGIYGGITDYVIAIVFDPNCNMLVLALNNTTNVYAVKKYNPQGGFVSTLVTFGPKDGPQSMAIGPDRNLYISNNTGIQARGLVNKYDINTGALISAFIPQQNLGTFNDMAWGGDNNLYIADEGVGPNYHGQVVRFTAAGAFKDVFVPYSSTLIDPVGIGFIVTPLGAPAPQTFSAQAAFRETGDSIWSATAPGLIQKQFDVMASWPSSSISKSGIVDIATPSVNLGLFTIPGIDFGSFGGSFSASTNGTAGLRFIGTLNAGAVNVNYPVTFAMNFPDRNYLFAGDWFSVYTSATPDPAANLGTNSPHVKAEADLIMNGSLNVHASAVAFSRSIFDTTIQPPAGYPGPLQHDINGNVIPRNFSASTNGGAFNYDREIFDTDSLLGNLTTFNYSLLNGAVTGYVHLPYITTTGMPDASGAITTTGSDTFFNLRGSLSDFIRNTIQDETGIYIPIGSDSVGKHYAGSGFDAGYSFLDIYANLNLNVAQDFVFTPKPHIKLTLPSGQTVNWKDKNNVQYNNVNTLEFDAGDTIQMQMPSSTILQLTPTYSLPNTFNQTLSLVIDPSLNLNVLELTASGSVAGFTLANFDFQPVPLQTINLQTIGVNPKFPLYSTGNFTLPGFTSTTQQGITVAGRLHPAPGLNGVSPSQMTLQIVPRITATQLPSNISSQSTPLMVKGYNFPASGAIAYFSIFGSAPVALATTTMDNCNLTVQLPNKYLLIAGTGQLYVTAPNTTGASNSISVPIVNPVPQIRFTGPSVYAADPLFTVGSPLLMTVTDASTTFLWGPDYYTRIKSEWAGSFGTDMAAFFPGYDFNTVAPLPAIHLQGTDGVDHTLALYEEAQSSGLLWAILPYNLYSKPDTAQVWIVSPGPGGGHSICPDTPTVNTLTLPIGYIAPSLLATATTNPAAGTGPLYPASVLPASGTFRLTVFGNPNPVPQGGGQAHGNFNAASAIVWDGTPLTTTFINSGELRADILASYTAVAGAHTISVATSVGGGATYNSGNATFSVKNPLPHLAVVDAAPTQVGGTGATSNILNPPSAISADPAFLGQPTAPQYNLAVSGTGFVSTSTVQWNGNTLATQFVTDTLVKAAVPYSNVATPTTAQIRVSNPTDAGGGGVSNSVSFTVTNALPTLTTLTPSTIATGTQGYDVALQGSGFYSGSVVSVNGSARTTTFNAQNALTVHLTAADLALAGTAQITVANPAPGGGTSAPLTLTIVIQAPISTLAGAAVTIPAGDSVTIPNFGNTAPTTEITIEFWQYANAAAGQSTFIMNPDNSSNRINAHVPYSGNVVYWDFGNITAGGRLSYIPSANIVGSWQHFAMVASNSGVNNPVGTGPYMAIYRNGVREAYKSGASSFTHTASDLVLGGGYNSPFAGQLDEVRVWNIARPAVSIAADVNASLQGNETGLFAYWKMDEGKGTTTADATGHGYAGTLSGNVTWNASGAAIDTVHVTPGVARPITLAGFDPNTPPQPLTFAISGAPANGAFTGGTSPTFLYTPGAGYTGTGGGADTFTYRATNGAPTASVPTTVKINYANFSTATVSGTLTFEGISASAPAQNVTFTFRPTDGTAIFTRVLQVPASGVFSVSGLPQKNYTVHIKGDKYLAINVAANAAAANVAGLTPFQAAGDGNNDNSVDSSDFANLIGAFNSAANIPGSGYDPTGDFDSDGLVDSNDFALMIGEFNNMGAM